MTTSITRTPTRAPAASRFATYLSRLHELLLEVAITTGDGTAHSAEDGMDAALGIITEAHASGNKVILIGNGGSAAIASHQALDLWNAAGVPALVFNDAAQLTCISNDWGYEQVFSRALEMFAQPGDVLIAISSSGRSQNILNAVEAARERGLKVLTYSGFAREAPLRSMGDLNFHIDVDHYGLVEVAHTALIHHLTDVLAERRKQGAQS